jgi:hypothetical protein
MQAHSIADQINQTAAGYRAGTVLLWGRAPVQPDDDVFPIASAVARGEVLELRFEQKGRGSPLKAEVLEIHEPGGFSLEKGTLRIRTASKVCWGAVDGEPRAGVPAVELRAAIG